MGRRFFPILAFGVLTFAIPLLILPSETGNVPLLPVGNLTQGMQEKSENPAKKQEQAKPAEEEKTENSAPYNTSNVIGLEDEGFDLLDNSTGKVIHVTAQEYVRGSLAAEMPPNFHPEALKAQAVAAHTYALYCKEHSQEEYDLEVDTENWKTYTTEELFRKRYGKLADAYWKTIREAADEVKDLVLVYQQEPIIAAYHSMSSGITEDAENVWLAGKPYLVPVESPGDKLAPDYETQESFTADQVSQAVREAYPDVELDSDPSSWIQVVERSEGGYASAVQVGDLRIHGQELRTLLGLRSSNFQVEWKGGKFLFTVKGYGHGVGLSQYGADYMGRQGSTFDEILTHYYPGVTLAAISPI